MSDTVYRPISNKDEESETHATTELPIASWSDFRKELEEAHEVSRDDLTVQEATESAVRRRAEVATPENAKDRPIVKHVSKDSGPQTLREATDNLAYSRGLQRRDQLLAEGFTEAEVQAEGIEKLEQARRGDPLDLPPVKVEIADEPGTENDSLTVEQAAERLSKWRADQAAQREAELAELDAERAQRQQEEYEQFQAQQQPEPEQPQEPDPVQQERAQVAQERQTTEAIKNLSFHEVASLNGIAQLARQIQQSFPELANVQSEQDLHNLHAQMQAQNPARAQALAQADQVMRQRQVALANLTNQRKAHEQQQTQAAAQQRAAARAEQDKAFEASAAKHIPNWERVQGEVRAQARKTLESAGLSPAEIHHLWTGDHSVDAHSSVLQTVLAKAAAYDLAQQKAHLIRQTPLPQVIKPGVGRSHGQDGAERVADLKAQLKTAKGNAAIRIGTQLMQAKRTLNH
jgi:hypothetical protein